MQSLVGLRLLLATVYKCKCLNILMFPSTLQSWYTNGYVLENIGVQNVYIRVHDWTVCSSMMLSGTALQGNSIYYSSIRYNMLSPDVFGPENSSF